MAASRQQLTNRKESGGGGRVKTSRPSTQPRRAAGTNGGSRPKGRAGEKRGGLLNLSAEQLARGLGWFSLGLGLAEALAPRAVARLSGVRGNTGLIQLMGLREIGHGLAIFAQGERPAAALWARVAGDALDLAALGGAFASPKNNKGRLAFATANVLAVTALDLLCARQLGDDDSAAGGETTVRKSVVINGTPAGLYRFWRDFQNLPRFMRHLQSVEETGDGRSHWVTRGPADSRVEWDAELTEDRENELIAWRSLEGSDVYTTGSVSFAPAAGGRGTVVRVEMDYSPPGGVIGKGIAKLFGEDPERQIYDDLRCLKQVMETGEVVLSDGTVWDNGVLTQRPGRPVSGEELAQSQGAG